MKVQELKQLVREALEEMSLGEMARTQGTGKPVTITENGEEMLKQIKQTGTLPANMSALQVQILKYLYTSKKEDKSASKGDFARSIGKPQPYVNGAFNALAEDGLISYGEYISKAGVSTGASAKPNIADLLGDLDI